MRGQFLRAKLPTSMGTFSAVNVLLGLGNGTPDPIGEIFEEWMSLVLERRYAFMLE